MSSSAHNWDRVRPYEYHVDPLNPALNGYSVPASSDIKNPLYGNSLVELDRRTDANLRRLQDKLLSIDPCYGYGMEHWHSGNNNHNGEYGCDQTQSPYSLVLMYHILRNKCAIAFAGLHG